MNYHLSQSIILPSRPSTERVQYRRQIAILSVLLLTAGLIATATPTSAAEATYPQTPSKGHAQGQMVGVFTGEFVDGAPVYRFPSVVVVATRKVELAKIAREEQLTRARQARARAAARNPA